jgi:hypothetical protein
VKKTISRAEQLANRANFESEGQLFLVRCVACSDEPDDPKVPKRGRENYAPMVASGVCAWCGWQEEEGDERD